MADGNYSIQYHQEHRHIQEIAVQFRAVDIEATALLVAGPTVDTILQQSEKLNPEMIIVGSHGGGHNAPARRQCERGRVAWRRVPGAGSPDAQLKQPASPEPARVTRGQVESGLG